MHRNVRADISGLVTLRRAVIAALQPTPGLASRLAMAAPPGGTRAGPDARARIAHRSAADAPLPARSAGYSAAEPEGTEGHRTVALVELAQSGDPEAFAQLYDTYLDTVYRYVYYRVGSRALAEDLTSETFLRALRRIGTFSWQGRDFGAWLVTIARNLVADHFKSSRFRLEVTTGEMLDADEVEDSPEKSVLEALSSTVLIDAIRRLNPRQQECVTLRFLQGLSVAATAKVMDKNEGAIKTLQYRAVRALARLLPDDVR